MERSSLEVARVDPDAPEASRLLEAYFLELRDRLAPARVDVLSRWPEDFRGPRAAVVVTRKRDARWAVPAFDRSERECWS